MTAAGRDWMVDSLGLTITAERCAQCLPARTAPASAPEDLGQGIADQPRLPWALPLPASPLAFCARPLGPDENGSFVKAILGLQVSATSRVLANR